MIELRPLEVPRDCEGLAFVLTASDPAWPMTAEAIAAIEQRRPPERLHIARVAIDDGQLVGYGHTGELGVSARPGRLRLRVVVHPQHRGAGVGATLYDALLVLAVQAGATELIGETTGHDGEARRFVARRGFAEFHRRIESRLALAELDTQAVGRGIDRLTDAFFASGVRVASFRQLQDATADAARRLYDLDAALWQDVPFGLTGSVPTFEQYQVEELSDPDFIAEATFVALDGDRWIGLSSLMHGKGFLLNAMTGVTRDWRRRGLARWLKLHAIRWALEGGAHELRTFNDSINDAMLALNRSLGFRVAGEIVRYRKELR
jgi:GNAT superfamily N-acetyltransferase